MNKFGHVHMLPHDPRILLASLLIWGHPFSPDQHKHVQTCLLGKVGSWPSAERLSWVCFPVTQVEFK